MPKPMKMLNFYVVKKNPPSDGHCHGTVENLEVVSAFACTSKTAARIHVGGNLDEYREKFMAAESFYLMQSVKTYPGAS